MRNPVRKRYSIELLKLMLDGNWYNTEYLKLAAGKFIPPEVASRVKAHGRPAGVEYGRAIVILNALKSFQSHERIERRHDSHGYEWRLKDSEWAKKMVELSLSTPEQGMVPSSESSKSTPSATITPTSEVSLTLPLLAYNSLLEAKQTYEGGKGGPTDWGAFLLLLLGYALGGKLIRPIQ